jgi:hypothetical protein
MVQMRLMAGLLAAGGIFWGLFCFLFIIAGDKARAFLVFGPGYLVTAGYVIRFRSILSLPFRRGIWAFSLLVQGAWLGWYLWGALHGGARSSAFEFLCVIWWSFAVVASLFGLVAEPREPST